MDTGSRHTLNNSFEMYYYLLKVTEEKGKEFQKEKVFSLENYILLNTILGGPGTK